MAKKSAVRTVLTLDCECGKYSYHAEKEKLLRKRDNFVYATTKTFRQGVFPNKLSI